MSSRTHFLNGLQSVRLGAQLMWTNPRLVRWVVAPVLIQMTLLVAMWFWLWGALPQMIGHSISGLGVSEGSWGYFVLYYPVLVALGLVAFVALSYLMYAMTLVMAAPFYSLLAIEGLKICGHQLPRHKGIGSLVVVGFRMLRVSMVKGAFFFAIGFVLALFTLVPLLNLVAAWLALFLMALDSFDYSFEADELGIGDRLAYAKREFVTLCGSSVALSLTVWLPGLTVLIMPLAVLGGAVLYSRSLSVEASKGNLL